MKITGRNIKRRLYGLRNLPSRIARARYFRGHGVHSPFVYSLVRQVFMRSSLFDGDHSLYDELLSRGVAKRRATELQNLMIHCSYSHFAIDSVAGNISIATAECEPHTLRLMEEQATNMGSTLCIMSPYNGRERQMCCHEIIKAHQSTSIDNRAYILLFNNHLPKQHFRI